MGRLSDWLRRGLGLAAAHVVIRVVLGLGMATFPLEGAFVRWGLLAVAVVLALAWGIADGRADRRVHTDAEHGSDLTLMWLKAGFVGGLVAGAIAWVLGFVPMLSLGGQPLLFELTSGAAWTVLLIFVPAIAGIAIGRWRAGRNRPAKADPVVDLEKV